MPRQFLTPETVLHDVLGIAPAANGSVQFYDIGTTTPRDTWDDFAMGGPNLNPNPVGLDSAGRLESQVWLDGEYTVVLRNAEAEVVATWDERPEQTAGATIPALEDGLFLTNDGANLLWDGVRQVPDPTGSNTYILSTDGANLLWIPQPTIPDPPAPDIEIDTTNRVVKIGAGESVRYVTMTGTGSAPASGQWTTSTSIVFPEGFDSLWNVFITITTDRVSTADSGFLPAQAVTGWTPGSASSGVTANFVLCEDDRSPANRFTSAVPFAWTAIGTITE